MAKRGAEEQITKDNVEYLNDGDADTFAPLFASADVMAKRKILKPKGKGNFSFKSANQFASSSTIGNFKSPNNSVSDKNLKLKALNVKFLEAVKNDGSSFLADYRPIARKYLDYYESIETESLGDSTKASSGSAPKGGSIFGGQEGLSTKSSSIENGGNASTTGTRLEENVEKPLQNNSIPTSTTATLQSDNDSDSEEEKKEIKIDGPKFTLSVKPTTKASPFSFGPKTAKKVDDDSSDSDIEIKGPSFTFSKPIQDPVFKFGKSEASKDMKNGAFLFGSASSPDSIKEALKDVPDTATSKSFIFGATTTTSSAPQFNFSTQSADSKLGTESQNPLLFGSLKDSNNGKPGTVFGFLNPVNPATKPSFNFGQSTSFGALKSTDASSGSAPLFSFNQTSQTSESAPKQSGFGGSSISFGSAPFAASAVKTTVQETPSLGATSVTGSQKEQKDDLPTAPGDSELAEEESGRDFAPVATLGDKKDTISNGEENELILFLRKSKLMLLDTKNKENPYKNLGIGEAKVLKNSSGKARVLIRADGGLRVLLNVSLLKDLTYSTIGNGSLVRVPAVNGEGELETYVIKVKTPTDGKELCDILNQAKGS